ncbi:MAG: HAD family hydrolase [Nitriliruptoraceae bacterium]
MSLAATTLPEGLRPGGRFEEWEPAPCRYLVCDVDGTLVGPEPGPTRPVVDAIARAEAAGVRVGYATGRMRDGVGALHRTLEASGPHVFHNGAEVRADGGTIAVWSLTHEQVDHLLAIAGAHEDVYLEVYSTSGYRVSSFDERARPHWELLGVDPIGVLTAAADLPAGPVPKATFTTFSAAAQEWLEAQLAPLDAELGVAGSPLTPGLVFTNVNQPGATKGAALAAAAAHLQVPLAEVAAVGDAGNDRSMLAVAGTAIAMGQAGPEIVEVAHLVTADVDADGLAVAIDALLVLDPAGQQPA